MNTNIIQGDSLLSNISNITVKIDHNRSDGSGFFKNYIKDIQNQKQIAIEDLNDSESINPESLLDRIIFKNKNHPNANQPENTWVTGQGAPGVSQQEQQSQNLQNSMQIQSSQKIVPQPSQNKIYQKDQAKKLRLLMEKRLKNQTKNIPKNYGKAIISFIQKYQAKVKQITQNNGVRYQDFIDQLKERKKTINTIADLRNMWIDYKHAKCMRLLSNLFLRKYSLNYIFNSRICNYASHIKYRYRLCQAIKQPYTFKHIKDY